MNQSKIELCEKEITKNAKEISQLENELMSPECNVEGLKSREAELFANQANLQRELISLHTTDRK